MPIESLPPAVRIAFVPFCVTSLTRSEIDRVFNAHGVTLPPEANPYSKRNLVDAYCKTFDWRNEVVVKQFRGIIDDVLSLGGDSEQATQARETFMSVCARNGVVIENGQLLNSGTPPFVDHALAIHEFLWRNTGEAAHTKEFRNRGHDVLLELLRTKADKALPGCPRIVTTQSLQDAGCDIVIEWGAEAKYGVQLKSHFDISEKEFAGKTTSQIQNSRQHGLNRLYVLLAGDLTDKSQEQKVRGFEATVSKMNDSYVRTVSPERVWTLLLAE
jgi:hypothetical protein